MAKVEIEGLAATMRYFMGIHHKGNWMGSGRDRRFKWSRDGGVWPKGHNGNSQAAGGWRRGVEEDEEDEGGYLHACRLTAAIQASQS